MSETSLRNRVTSTVDLLDRPSHTWREAAEGGEANLTRHDSLLQAAGCMNAVELRQPVNPATPASSLTVACWNLERCKHVPESAARLQDTGADICLLTEMDLGMARSGNRHTTADLAHHLGMGYAFGVEFIELGLGDRREQAEHTGERNEAGLHGNAVATRFAIDRAALLPLDRGGMWYSPDGIDQRRIGGRMALAVRLCLAEPVWFVAVHYESRLFPHDRERETAYLLRHVDELCGDDAVLVGGDFNCRAMADEGFDDAALLDRPQEAEPMFARLAEAGFDWRACNTAQPTTRLHSWDDRKRMLKKIDWFFSRGLKPSAPRVIPAVAADGRTLSDHEIIVVTVSL